MARTTKHVMAIHLSGQAQRWAVYVRWLGGRRETIVTAVPDLVVRQR